ncbi:MAG: hypothetical protein ACJ70S_07430, partial [Nitrososphaera sp.]
MQAKPILMFMTVATLVGTIVIPMTTSNVFATQIGNSSNSNNNNINASKCQENDSQGDNVDGSATVSTSSNDNAASANDQYPLPKFDPCNFGNETIDNPYFALTPGTTFTYQTKTEDGT